MSDTDLIYDHDLTPFQRGAVKSAEEKIRRALYELEEETHLYVDSVSVDTRNFARLGTEIWLTKRMRH